MQQIKNNLSHLNSESENLNFTKKISREINSKLGLPISFGNEVMDTLIEILIDNIKSKELNVKILEH